MSQLLTDLTNSAVWTVLQQAGNANGNGTVLDLSTYKGPVTFVCAVGQSTHGVGTLNVANIEDSADNATFTAVTGGAFTAVVNTANASNVGIQKKTFDVRALDRYVRVPIEVSGTNANIPLAIHVIGQLERKAD
jgi:hypothetical protein